MMKQDISKRLEALRAQMARAAVDAIIIPQTDPHQSEYIADHWQVRRFLTGFTGSAGSLVVTAEKALLWADSRYFIQAAEQIAGTEIVLMKDGLPETPSIDSWIADNLKPGQVVGIDGMLFSVTEAERMRRYFDDHGIAVKSDFDPIDEVWTDRPPLPKDPVFVHDVKYAGESAHSKIEKILQQVQAADRATALFVTPLDEIAWALNIRCRDVRWNPVTTAYLYLSSMGNTLFVDLDKITPEVRAYLKAEGVDVAAYSTVKDFLRALPTDEKVLIDPAKTSITVFEILGSHARKGVSPIPLMKATKNETQMAGIRAAMERDGVALVRAVMEIERMVAAGERLTELGVDALLLKYRSEQPLFFDESFGSIVGYGPHAALPHYAPTPESDVEIPAQGLLLIDSGAQYLDGTTDITRTFSLGNPTEMERHDFTLVLKGHIALGRQVFPVGTVGMQLDALARMALWNEGLQFLHGTGHGVGHFLNVHEGPQSIRMNYVPTALAPGMITSNEPGLYREGVHGIRCENLVLTVPAMDTEFGRFLRFETVTLFPFDLSLVETENLTADEKAWLNAYHAEVYARLAPALTPEEQAWLKSKTTPIE